MHKHPATALPGQLEPGVPFLPRSHQLLAQSLKAGWRRKALGAGYWAMALVPGQRGRR